jgi:hypothetical protein
MYPTKDGKKYIYRYQRKKEIYHDTKIAVVLRRLWYLRLLKIRQRPYTISGVRVRLGLDAKTSGTVRQAGSACLCVYVAGCACLCVNSFPLSCFLGKQWKNENLVFHPRKG